MHGKSFLGSLLILVSASALAQVPAADLAKPPSGAVHFVIQSTAGKHGDSWLWKAADGTRMGRETLILRGQVFELDVKGRPGADGMPVSLEVRGFTPTGDAAETFSIASGKASWKSQVDAGSTAYSAPAFYSALNGPIENTAWAIEALLARPGKTLPLLPSGKARAEKLTTIVVGQGANRKEVTAWAILGVSTTPVPVWADADNKFFALSFFLSWLPEAYAAEHDTITVAQTKAMSERMPALRNALLKTPAGPVAFTNVQIYDADTKSFLAGQSVVVADGRIAAVGAAKSVKVPAGAQVFDGRGKTLVPGLWDCHLHVSSDYAGIQALSMGVTSIRDPGNDDDQTIDRRTRSANGQLLLPNVYPSSLIDGKGENTAQVANVATSQAEAIARVDEAKKKGFIGVKFYGTLDKAWLPAAAAEAHKLGLHVHGHIPAGMRPLEAINAGYDELTHINWVAMQAMPDEVIQKSNGILRFEGPGRYMKDTDLDSGPIKVMIDTMAAKGIYSDPTMVTFESLYVPENGDISPSYSPFIGTLPPSVERGYRVGGFKVPEGLTRADYRASWAKMVQLVGRMHKAGVPIVAGTDGSGIELIHELEIYVDAGMTPGEALATATIVPAKLVGQEKNTGSIKVGKVADLVLVEGDPSKNVGALRQTRTVVFGGKLLDADALRAAAGFSGRPK